MKTRKLNQCETVKYINEPHSYIRLSDNKQLQGITKMIGDTLFPNFYSDVPTSILEKARERGKHIHYDIQLFENHEIESETPEIALYKTLKKEHNITILDTEYLVSDNENFATPIDAVGYRKGFKKNQVALWDVKSTATLNREYVSWQLSVSAGMFELLNPHLEVVELGVIWLRDKGAYNELPRMQAELVDELKECWLTGKEFINTLKENSEIDKLQIDYYNHFVKIEELKAQIKEIETVANPIKDKIFDYMGNAGINKIEKADILFTRIEPTTRVSFDSKSLEKDSPEIYKKYLKQSEVKGSMRVTLRELK